MWYTSQARISNMPVALAKLINALQDRGIALNRVWLRVTPPSVVASSPQDMCDDAPATPVPRQPLPRSKQAAAAAGAAADVASSSRAAPQPQPDLSRSSSTGDEPIMF